MPITLAPHDLCKNNSALVEKMATALGRTLQIRTEIESAIEGTLRRGAVMARMANQVIPDYKEQLKLMEATASSGTSSFLPTRKCEGPG